MRQVFSYPDLSLVKGEFLWSSSRVLLVGNRKRTLHSPTSKKCSSSISVCLSSQSGAETDDDDSGEIALCASELANRVDGERKLTVHSKQQCATSTTSLADDLNAVCASVDSPLDVPFDSSASSSCESPWSLSSARTAKSRFHCVNDVVALATRDQCLAIAVGGDDRHVGSLSVYEMDLRISPSQLRQRPDVSSLLSSQLRNTEGNMLMSVCAHNPTATLAVAQEDGTITIFDSNSFAFQQSFCADESGVTTMSFTADGQLAVCSRHSTVPLRLFDLRTTGNARSDWRASTSGSSSSKVSAMTSALRQCNGLAPNGSPSAKSKSVTFSPNPSFSSSALLSPLPSSLPPLSIVSSVSESNPLPSRAEQAVYRSPVCSPTRTHLSSPSRKASSSMSKLPITTRPPMPFSTLQPQLSCLKTHHSDAKIITGDSRGTVSVWDLRVDASIDFPIHDSIVTDVALHPQSTERIMSAGRDGKLCAFSSALSVQDAQLRSQTIFSEITTLSSIAVDEESALVMVTSDDGRVWNSSFWSSIR